MKLTLSFVAKALAIAVALLATSTEAAPHKPPSQEPSQEPSKEPSQEPGTGYSEVTYVLYSPTDAYGSDGSHFQLKEDKQFYFVTCALPPDNHSHIGAAMAINEDRSVSCNEPEYIYFYGKPYNLKLS